MGTVDFHDVQRARERISRFVHCTPVITCQTLDDLTGARLFFKCENFQKVGAFKFRGACNAVFSLSEKAACRGVVTHSSGNHAAALALAARSRAIPAYIVMPSNAPNVKRQAVLGYGGIITECEPNQNSRETAARTLLEHTGAAMIHPYDDDHVIAGQGTAAMELLEQTSALDAIVAPIGGGGLMSGTILVARAIHPNMRVYGVEPHQADDARQSLREGRIVPARDLPTVADGLRTSLGEKTFSILRNGLDDVVYAEEEEIIAALRLIFERMKIIIEPSSAVAVAALIAQRLPVRGMRVGVILSGGNIDVTQLPFPHLA